MGTRTLLIHARLVGLSSLYTVCYILKQLLCCFNMHLGKSVNKNACLWIFANLKLSAAGSWVPIGSR